MEWATCSYKLAEFLQISRVLKKAQISELVDEGNFLQTAGS